MSCIPMKSRSKIDHRYSTLRKSSMNLVAKFISSLTCQSHLTHDSCDYIEERSKSLVKPTTYLSDEIFIPETSYENLRNMTHNFSLDDIIGEGKFGTVFKSNLKSGRDVAVKVVNGHDLSIPIFTKEVAAINQLQHPNLAELLSYTCSENCHALIYEFAMYGSLYDVLHGKPNGNTPLDNRGIQNPFVLSWNQRVQIALDVAKGLRYLHEFNSVPSLTHKGLKSSNVLIFKGLRAKIIDFDLDLSPLNQSTISSGILGSFGYNAPESGMIGQFTPKTDVYSFGIILFELLTGRKPINHKMPKSQISLVKWVLPKLSSSNLDQCMDPKLNSMYSTKDAYNLAELACACVNFEQYSRPSMADVVTILSSLCENSN